MRYQVNEQIYLTNFLGRLESGLEREQDATFSSIYPFSVLCVAPQMQINVYPFQTFQTQKINVYPFQTEKINVYPFQTEKPEHNSILFSPPPFPAAPLCHSSSPAALTAPPLVKSPPAPPFFLSFSTQNRPAAAAAVLLKKTQRGSALYLSDPTSNLPLTHFCD